MTNMISKSKLPLLFFMLLFFSFPKANIYSLPTPIVSKNSEIPAEIKTKKEIRHSEKLQRKMKRFESKLKKINDPEKNNKKAKRVLIVGVVFLLLGLLILASASSVIGAAGCLESLLLYPLGVACVVGGLITMIIGLIQSA